MRVVFGVDFDGGSWPGPLGEAGRDAALGTAWLGPRGLLSLLEVRTGTGGLFDVDDASRAAAIAAAVRAHKGFFAASAQHDALVVARTLLRWRERLLLSGLDPQAPRSAWPLRVRELLQACDGAPMGTADRLWRVLRALRESPRTDLASLDLVDDEAALPPLWRAVLSQLRAGGVAVGMRPVDDAPADGDLLAARTAPFLPQGDGSLLLLRADCPEEAALQTAALLQTEFAAGRARDVVVIGGDDVLDTALVRAGLPPLGGPSTSGPDGLAAVAPLVLALCAGDPDPATLFSFLQLPRSPVPRPLRGPMSRALLQCPSAWGAPLRQAFADALPLLDDADRRRRAADRVRALVPTLTLDESNVPPAARATPRAALLRSLDVVMGWFVGLAKDDDDSPYRAAAAHTAALRRLVVSAAGSGDADAVAPVAIARAVYEATRAQVPRPPHLARAGFHRVKRPGAVVATAPVVVWWRFDRDSAPSVRPLPLSKDERQALAAGGVFLDDAATAAADLAARAARPLRVTSRRLLLVCPRRGSDGNAAHPHPVWDEVQAKGARGSRWSAVCVARIDDDSAVRPRLQAVPRASLPQPTVELMASPVLTARPPVESPSAIEELIGCPLRYLLRAQHKRRRVLSLPTLPQVEGELLHAVLAKTFAPQPTLPAPAQAEALARLHFDALGPMHAGALFSRAQLDHRSAAKNRVARAAFVLATLLHDAGLRVLAVEQDLERTRGGRTLRGRLDLLAGDGRGNSLVIDHKRGADEHHRRRLESGLSVQLALYASLVKDQLAPLTGGGAPAIAYFQVQSARLLTVDDRAWNKQPFDDSTDNEVEPGDEAGPALVLPTLRRADHTFNDVVVAVKVLDEELQRGLVRAPGAVASDELSELPEGRSARGLQLRPPCWGCEHAVGCGRAFRRAAPVPSRGGRAP